MEVDLINYMKDNNLSYVPILEPDSLQKITDLYFHDILFNPQTLTEMFYVGRWHRIKENYDEMLKYLKNGIERGYEDSMNELGSYYYNIEDNIDEAKKYHMMGVKKGNVLSMCNLGIIHMYNGDYKLGKKYFKMASKKGNVYAMNKLGVYYLEHKKNTQKYIKAKSYFLTAIEMGDIESIYNLGIYYENLYKYDQSMKYYAMASEKGHAKSMFLLGKHYKSWHNHVIGKKYILMAIEKEYAEAMDYWADYLNSVQKIDEAKKYYMMAIQKNHQPSISKLEIMYCEQSMYLDLIELHVMYPDVFDREEIISNINNVFNSNHYQTYLDRIAKLIINFEFKPRDALSVGVRLFLSCVNNPANTLKNAFQMFTGCQHKIKDQKFYAKKDCNKKCIS